MIISPAREDFEHPILYQRRHPLRQGDLQERFRARTGMDQAAQFGRDHQKFVERNAALVPRLVTRLTSPAALENDMPGVGHLEPRKGLLAVPIRQGVILVLARMVALLTLRTES